MYFVIGDVHGCLDKLEELLKQWNPEKEKLIILGDLIDRGPNSLGVIRKAMELKEKHGAVILMGNHDGAFIDWLEDEDMDSEFYFDIGGDATVDSFFGEYTARKNFQHITKSLIKEKFQDEITFLKEMPLYYETPHVIFVHAGVNLLLADWKNSKESDFYLIRERFHHTQNETGKYIVFGHSEYLCTGNNNQVWVSNCGTKICIDGGAVFGHVLIGIKMTEAGEFVSYSV